MPPNRSRRVPGGSTRSRGRAAPDVRSSLNRLPRCTQARPFPTRMGPVTGRMDDVRRWLDENLPRRAAEHEVPGASVAILVDGQRVQGTSGLVDLRTGVEVTPDT
jgi:CubicO group peptidase (beta-lactamase class C family)